MGSTPDGELARVGLEYSQRLYPNGHVADITGSRRERAWLRFARMKHRIGLHSGIETVDYDHATGRLTPRGRLCVVCEKPS